MIRAPCGIYHPVAVNPYHIPYRLESTYPSTIRPASPTVNTRMLAGLAKPRRANPRVIGCRWSSKPTHPAPGTNSVPVPNPPPRMVEEQAPPRGLRALIGKLFEGRQLQPTFAQKQQNSLTNLGGSQGQVPVQDKVQYLHTTSATNLLFWYCPDLTFSDSDFKRVGPANSRFRVTRARNPVNLTPWMGYFLEFDSVEDAMHYYEDTIGHELCGFPLKLKFTSPEIRGFKAALLEKAPQVTRRAHALILGLPVGFPAHNILRVLWDYDLIDDDSLAVERLPVGEVKYGGNPFLLRFKSEKEAARFVRDHDGEVFPYSDSKILCQIID